MFSALQSTSGPLTDGENGVQIDASEFGALLWRHLTTKRKQQYRCATTVLPVHNCQKYFGKFTSYVTFCAHKLVHSEPCFDYLYEIFRTLLNSSVRKIFLYRCSSTFSALNNCSGIFFKSISYLYEVVRTNFYADFRLFAIFDRNFAKIVAPASDGNVNCVAILQLRSLLKKRVENRIKIDP